MRKSVSLFIIVFFFFQLFSLSQAFNDIEWYDADSLLKVLPDQTGEERLQTLNALAASLSFEDKEKCRFYATSALSLAGDLKDIDGLAAVYRNFGRMEFYDGNYPKALNYFQESLKLFESQGNTYLCAKLIEDIATTHFFARNFEKIFELVHKSLDLYRIKDADGKTFGNARDTMSIYSRVGLPYRMKGRSDISCKIYLNYLKIGELNNFEITDMMLHNGLLAMCYFETENYDSAFYYFRQAEKYQESNESIRALKYEHKRRMAGIHLKLGNIDSAINLLGASFQWFSERGFLKQSQLAAFQLGEIHLRTGRINKALDYFLRSDELLKEMIRKGSYYRYDSLKYVVSWGSELYLPFTKKQMKEAIYEQSIILYDRLYQLYLMQNKIHLAMQFLLACSNAKDTLRLLTSNRESIEIQTRFESERKDTEILNLSQQNKLKELKLAQTRWFVVGLAGLVIFVILFAMILNRQHKLRNSQQTLLLQQKLLRSQMNPHFIFNSLASIQNSIINEEPQKASKYLARFSRLVRSILDSTVDEFIPLEQEISTVENYLELQKIRFPDKFVYSVEVDESLDTQSIRVPPMLAQPFIENSIEHGIKHKDSMGKIEVRFKSQNGMMELEVEDDGIGRHRAQEILNHQDKEHKSMATVITLERISVLNRKLSRKISMEIIDLKDGHGEAKGTKVLIGIPV